MHMCLGIRVYVCVHTCMCVYTYMHVYTRRCQPQPPPPWQWMDAPCVSVPAGVSVPRAVPGGAVPAPLPQQRHRPRSLPPSSPSRRRSRTETQKAAGAGPRRHHDGDHQDPRYPAGLRQLQPHHQGPHPDVRSVLGRGLRGRGEGGRFEGRSRAPPGAGAPGGRCPRRVVLKALRGEAEPHPRPPAVGCVSLRKTGFPLCTHLVRPAA